MGNSCCLRFSSCVVHSPSDIMKSEIPTCKSGKHTGPLTRSPKANLQTIIHMPLPYHPDLMPRPNAHPDQIHTQT